MNAKSLLWGFTLFVLSLQQMHAQFTVGTLDRDAYKYWLVDDKYTKDWNVYFAEQEYSGKKVQCGILADSVVAGKTYQVIERTGVDMTADTLLYRQEGKKVFRHTEKDGTDILLFDFGLNEGDEFVTHDGETWIVADIDEEYQNWDNTNRKFVLTGKEDGEQKDVWVEDVGSLYTGILTRADLPPTNTPRLLYCRQIEMTSWRFDVNLPSYDAVFFLDGDFRNEEDLYFFESLLMDNSLDGDSLFVEFIGDSLRLYGIMEINMYVYLMESREQDGIINLNRTDVHFGDEYLGHARRWIDIVIPGFEEGEYEVVYEGKSLGKYTCKGKKQSVSMFDGNPQWVYYIWHMIQEYNEEADDFYYTSEITYKRYFTDGTTTYNSKDYHLMYSQNTYSNGTVSDARFLYRIREEDGRVYIPAEDFNSCYKELSEDIENFHHYPLVGDEYVIYDFNLSAGESFAKATVTDVSEVIINDGNARNIYTFNGDKHVLAGIGATDAWGCFDLYLAVTAMSGVSYATLNRFTKDGVAIYTAPQYDGDKDKEWESYRTYREDPFLTEDNQSSGIEEITTNTTNCRTDNAIYDLMGRRLNGVPAKGIYIQNGKKYVR